MWILLIITFILLLYSVSLEYKYNSITTYPRPQCYNDYLCKTVIDNKVVEVNMSDKTLFDENSSLKICSPLTVDNICNYTYTNQNGEVVTESPGSHINTWSKNSLCTYENNYINCPAYQIGDIYWRGCFNNFKNNKYNNYERTYFNGIPIISNCPK